MTPVPSGPRGRRLDPRRVSSPGAVSSAALLADVEETTRQAAIDGLPLSQVFEDLRLVLDLEPHDDLPADVLRAAALAWERSQQALTGEGPYDGVPCTTVDHLESHLWSLLGACPDAPARALIVRTERAADLPDGLALREVDLLVAAARTLLPLLDGPGEYVGLVRDPGARTPDRMVALAGDDERLAAARGALSDVAPPGGPTIRASLHDLRGHPDGCLPAVREALG